MKPECTRQILESSSNIKFREKSFHWGSGCSMRKGGRAGWRTERQTERSDESNSLFSNSENVLQNGEGKQYIQCVPLATKPGISLIILTPMKILQRNLNRSTFVVWEMKRNVSVVCVCSRCNILISGKIIKEMPGSVASGTHGMYMYMYILYIYVYSFI